MTEATVVSSSVSLRFIARRALTLIDRHGDLKPEVRQRLSSETADFLSSVRKGEHAVSKREFKAAMPADLAAASAVVDALIWSHDEAPRNAEALDRLLAEAESAIQDLGSGNRPADTATLNTRRLFGVLSDFAVSSSSHNFDETPTTGIA